MRPVTRSRAIAPSTLEASVCFRGSCVCFAAGGAPRLLRGPSLSAQAFSNKPMQSTASARTNIVPAQPLATSSRKLHARTVTPLRPSNVAEAGQCMCNHRGALRRPAHRMLPLNYKSPSAHGEPRMNAAMSSVQLAAELAPRSSVRVSQCVHQPCRQDKSRRIT